MVVIVFDADVLIAYLNRQDAHHAEAVERVRRVLVPGVRRVLSAVTYSEVLIGPLRARGLAGVEAVDRMLARLRIETVEVCPALARRAAVVRAETNLKLPDAYVLATALQAGDRGVEEVRPETFDEKVAKAHAALRERRAR